MHYDDGVDVQPGDQLTINGEQLGQAVYDVDGDGVADSYIAITGEDEVTVFTDSDDNGTVDTAYIIDGHGSVTEYEQGQDGKFAQTGTGQLDENGRIQMQGGTPTGPGDGPVGPTGPGTNGPGDPGGITLQEGGQTVTVGAPTVDVTGDGVNDTVVLQGSDGSTVLIADTDQNGQADTIAQVNQDGSVVFAVPDGHGGWVVAGHGHIDSNGTITQDPGGQTGQPYDPPVDLTQGQPTGPTGQPTDPSGPTGPTGPTGPGTSPGAGEDITIEVNGQVYEVGAATVDADGDGTPDTVIAQTADGATLVVTDVDGNGTGDQVLEVQPDGSVVVRQSDGAGGWVVVATGHVDANGNVVIDQ